MSSGESALLFGNDPGRIVNIDHDTAGFRLDTLSTHRLHRSPCSTCPKESSILERNSNQLNPDCCNMLEEGETSQMVPRGGGHHMDLLRLHP